MTNHCVMCDSEIPPRTDGREVCPWCGTEHVGIVQRSKTNHFRLDLTLIQPLPCCMCFQDAIRDDPGSPCEKCCWNLIGYCDRDKLMRAAAAMQGAVDGLVEESAT